MTPQLAAIIAQYKKLAAESPPADKPGVLENGLSTSLWGDNKVDQNGNLNRFASPQTLQHMDGAKAGPAAQPGHPGVTPGAMDLTKHYLGSVQGVKDLGSDYVDAMKRGHLGAVLGTAGGVGAAGLLAYLLTRNKKRRA